MPYGNLVGLVGSDGELFWLKFGFASDATWTCLCRPPSRIIPESLVRLFDVF